VTQPQKVMFVGDSPAVAQLVHRHLEAEPLELITAANAADAMRVVEAGGCDVVLLDSALAVDDPLELCRRIATEDAIGQAIVLLMTSPTDTATRRRGLAMGAADFIAKPIDPLELTTRVRMAMRMQAMARLLATRGLIDSLTGLRNQLYFCQRIEQELSQQRRTEGALSCLWLDLDSFRQINLAHGVRGGDEVLRHVGDILMHVCRSSDVVCRGEGDCFGVIAPNTTAEGLLHLAERIRQRIEAMVVPWRGQALRVTASIAVCDAAGNAQHTLEGLCRTVAHLHALGGNRLSSIDPAAISTAA